MKRLFLGLLIVAFATLHSQNSSLAQQSDGRLVAVLDVARVFKENLEFAGAMDKIRQNADQLKVQIQAKQEEIRQAAMALADKPQGSPERNQLEAQLEQRQTALRTEARQDEADLLAKEAQLYYNTYLKMQEVVAQIADQNNVGLVLRFDSAPIDKENRAEVIMGVNRAVIYHYKLDLTNLVIKNMGPTVAQTDDKTPIK